jgi:hypothetical protein
MRWQPLRVPEAAERLAVKQGPGWRRAQTALYTWPAHRKFLGTEGHVSQVLTIQQLWHINNKAPAELEPDKFGKQTD